MNKEERDEKIRRCGERRQVMERALACLVAVRATVLAAVETAQALHEPLGDALQQGYEDILSNTQEKVKLLHESIVGILIDIHYLRRESGNDPPAIPCKEHAYVRICPSDICTAQAGLESRGFEITFRPHCHVKTCVDCGHVAGYWHVRAFLQPHPSDDDIIPGPPPAYRPSPS
jgi:hypothetical protein